MRLGDVVDQLHDDDGLADAGAAEQPDLAALGVGGEQIHHLDAGLEDLGFCRLVDEGGRLAVDRIGLVGGDRPALVHRIAHDVEDAAERVGSHRHGDRASGILDLLTPDQPVGGVHGDRPDHVLAQMLRHFEDEPGSLVVAVERVEDARQRAVELNVDHGAHHLRDASRFARRCHLSSSLTEPGA